MAGKSAILTVKILTDASQAGKGVDQATTKLGKFSSGLSRVTPYAAAAGAGLVAFGKSTTDAAAKTEQAMGAVETVFGKSSGNVKSWAADAANSVGLAESEYATLAAQVGGQLQNMGFSQDESAKATQRLIEQGADLAATYGGTTAEAVEALGSALRGEADPAERYALSLNQTKVNSELAAKGMDKLTGDAATQAKAMATLDLVTAQSANAQGQFAREADTASGAAERNAAAWENAKSQLGEALLPALTAVTQTFAQLGTWVSQNTTLVLALAGVIATFVVGVFAANAAIKIYQATMVAWSVVTKSLTIAQRALNAVMRANPVGIVITVIVALIAAIVALWKKNAGFRDFVKGVWKTIANAAKVAWNGIKAAANAVVNWMRKAISSVGNFINGIWRKIASTAKTVWAGIRAVVNVYITAIKSIVRGLTAVAKGVWNAIKASASSVWRGIRTVVNTVVSSIKTILRSIQSVASSVWSSVKNAARTALNAILAPVRAVKSAFDSVVSAIRSVIGWISRIKFPSPPSWLSKVLPGGARATAPTGYAARSGGFGVPQLRAGGFAAAPVLAGVVSGGITINVTGTLNDADSARAVRRVLRNDSRRRGGVVLDRRRFEGVS
jgi:hypothetical protein